MSGNFKHGHNVIGNRSRTYNSWAAMTQRCMDPKHKHYHRYGGRGIKICRRWRDFRNFLADMGECPDGHSLDRINNQGNYNRTNCRWATQKQQVNNSSTIRWICWDGRIQSLTDWSKEFGYKRVGVLHQRIRRMSWEKAMVPFQPRRKA